MTELEIFQKTHGAAWKKLVQQPVFTAGLQLLNIRKVDSVASLSDEHIERHSREILGGLRDYFQHENDLLTLHNRKEFGLPMEEEMEYVSPEQQAEMEALVSRFREDNRKKHG